jgi:hypothetical protein
MQAHFSRACHRRDAPAPVLLRFQGRFDSPLLLIE